MRLGGRGSCQPIGGRQPARKRCSARVVLPTFTENEHEDDDEKDIWRNLRCNA